MPAPPASAAVAGTPWPASAAACLLVALLVALTLAAGPAFDYARSTARQLVERRGYVDAVFGVGSLSAPLEPAAPRAPAPTLADVPPEVAR
jgi:formate hydrogenlyase subunit 3/multisubunit Na+/H+ antiporter MnhD subunit